MNLLQQSPCILLGDYNKVLSSNEVYSISPPAVCYQDLQEFSGCLEECGIFYLAFRGCQFTWSNKSVTNLKAWKIEPWSMKLGWIVIWTLMPSFMFLDHLVIPLVLF